MQVKKFFSKHQGVVALTSGAAVDFTPVDFDAPLTDLQRSFLYRQTGIDIPQVFWRKQIHGDDILAASGGAASVRGCADADAFITKEKNLPIAIRTADCVPVFILDPVRHAVGLAHAGWKGTAKSIAAKTVQRMEARYGSQPSDLKISLGPCIRQCCYQVGKEFYEHFSAHLHRRDGYIYADMIGANRDQLLQAGVRQENIFDSGICTCCNTTYFSFRREGAKAGRMISLMMLI
ncbi:MAG: peptidoglycan editing factor PgeF [Candidatus Omnitrophica bacterium]|nr:peptidoglycan editing factor PgeF [Candidatus Omnitrophota bacterium]MDE2222433.1 peptidoglycan editing factor PgeF [Candidatus Omnitrophota bacterium]